MIAPGQRLALYMEGAFVNNTGKMGLSILRYGQNPVAAMICPEHVGQSCFELTGIDREVPIVGSLREAHLLGAEVLVLGIAPPGGEIPATWRPIIDESMASGMSLVNGLHEQLAPQYPGRSEDQFVWDIRQEPVGLRPGTGAARELDAKRVLMIGTDMSVGKMTAGLELCRSLGDKATFVATGQVGMAVTGAGVALDAVRVDFAAGAIEREVLAAAGRDVIVVEGQGSLIHPGSTANMALIRGAVPTHFVLVHRAGMDVLPRLPWVRVPPLRDVIRLYEDLAAACGVFDRPTTAGVALNTFELSPEAASLACQQVEDDLGIPCVDPVRHGADRLAEALLRLP